MSSRKRATCTVLIIAAILAAVNAYSNGINPPRPSGTNVVKSICKESLGGRKHEVSRTRIMHGPNPVESLNLVIGGVNEQINITDIRTITISAGTADSDGFVDGSLIRVDGTEEKAVKVQVKTKNASIYLTGFRENGTQLNIDFTKCKSIEFSSLITSNESHKPVMKK